jgi:hypothetical protein
MRAAQVTPNASLFLAVLRFCRRELQLELAERMMLEYIRSDAAWRVDVFRAHEEVVGIEGVGAFNRRHEKLVRAKRAIATPSQMTHRSSPMKQEDIQLKKKRAL